MASQSFSQSTMRIVVFFVISTIWNSVLAQDLLESDAIDSAHSQTPTTSTLESTESTEIKSKTLIDELVVENVSSSTSFFNFMEPLVSMTASLFSSAWISDFLNYFPINGNIWLESLYDLNVYYLSSMTENIKFSYHYLLTQLFTFSSFLFYSSKTSSSPSQKDGESSSDFTMFFLNSSWWPTIIYYFYVLKAFLFRIETICFLCVFVALSLVFRWRSTIIDSNQAQNLPQHHVNLSSPLGRLLANMFRFINVTILFTYLFNFIGATIRGYLYENESLIIQVDFGQTGVYSMQGRRPNMEDTFSLKNNVADELGIEYYAVYDGHGGPNAALFAEKEIFEGLSKRIKNIVLKNTDSAVNSKNGESTKNLPSQVQENTTESSSTSTNCPRNNFEKLTMNSLKTILNEEIIEIDKKLIESFSKRSDISGTTAIIAARLLHSNKLVVANVGDSRAILCDWKGSTIPLSFDHKPYQIKEYRRILEAGGYITLKGVYRVNGILAISRALGDYPLKGNRLIIPDPDILTFDLDELKPRFIIMASDGFWDTFSNENAARFVYNELGRYSKAELATTPSKIAVQIAKRLSNEAYTRESYDNITVIFIMFDEESSSTITVSPNHKSANTNNSSAKATKSRGSKKGLQKAR